MSQGARGRTKNQLVERIVDMVLWAIARQHPVTPEDIKTRWSVSRATAHRYRDLLRDAQARAQLMRLPRAATAAEEVAA